MWFGSGSDGVEGLNLYRLVFSIAVPLGVVVLIARTNGLSNAVAQAGATDVLSPSQDHTVTQAGHRSPHVEAEYVGTKRCRMCHSSQYRSWKKSAKKHAWESLKPGTKQEAKRFAGLDLSKDYRTDERCLICHSVGYGKPGGYAVANPSDERALRAASHREGVGCEACHGPGGEFIKIMSDISENDRRYDPSELWAAGQAKLSAEVCTNCHNDQAYCVLRSGDTPGSTEHRARYEVQFSNREGYHKQYRLANCNKPVTTNTTPPTPQKPSKTAARP